MVRAKIMQTYAGPVLWSGVVSPSDAPAATLEEPGRYQPVNLTVALVETPKGHDSVQKS